MIFFGLILLLILKNRKLYKNNISSDRNKNFIVLININFAWLKKYYLL